MRAQFRSLSTPVIKYSAGLAGGPDVEEARTPLILGPSALFKAASEPAYAVGLTRKAPVRSIPKNALFHLDPLSKTSSNNKIMNFLFPRAGLAKWDFRLFALEEDSFVDESSSLTSYLGWNKSQILSLVSGTFLWGEKRSQVTNIDFGTLKSRPKECLGKSFVMRIRECGLVGVSFDEPENIVDGNEKSRSLMGLREA